MGNITVLPTSPMDLFVALTVSVTLATQCREKPSKMSEQRSRDRLISRWVHRLIHNQTLPQEQEFAMPQLTKENTVVLLSYDTTSLREIEPGIKVSTAWTIGKKRMQDLEYVALVTSQTADSYEFGRIIGHYRIDSTGTAG